MPKITFDLKLRILHSWEFKGVIYILASYRFDFSDKENIIFIRNTYGSFNTRPEAESFYINKGDEIWFYPRRTLTKISSTYNIRFSNKIGRFLVRNSCIEKTRLNGDPSAQRQIGKKNTSFWVIKRAKIEDFIPLS